MQPIEIPCWFRTPPVLLIYDQSTDNDDAVSTFVTVMRSSFVHRSLAHWLARLLAHLCASPSSSPLHQSHIMDAIYHTALTILHQNPICILILILASLQLLDLNTQPCTAFLGTNWSILLPLTQLLLTYLVQSLWKRLSLDAATAFLINHLPCIVWAHSFFSVHWTLYIISCKN